MTCSDPYHLHYFWWREIIRFWNSIVELPAGSIWRDIMLDNLADQDSRCKNWSGQVKAFLSGIGYSSGALQLESISSDEVLQHLLRQYDGVWAELGRFPRVVTSQVSLTTYYRWMRSPDGEWLDRPGYLFLRLGHRQMYTFIRFKLGCHHLAIVTGRWHGVPRADRLCRRCDAGALDDERHLVFECLAFEDLRRTHSQLFGPEVAFDMRQFFAHRDQRAVVMYILGCLRLIEHAHE